jgi:hypothetical protein
MGTVTFLHQGALPITPRLRSTYDLFAELSLDLSLAAPNATVFNQSLSQNAQPAMLAGQLTLSHVGIEPDHVTPEPRRNRARHPMRPLGAGVPTCIGSTQAYAPVNMGFG